jgi:hypothetical protein
VHGVAQVHARVGRAGLGESRRGPAFHGRPDSSLYCQYIFGSC